MLLILVLILILIWATVATSIYSNFLIFYSNFWESENYHKAYYNSIAALERAELVTKQRSPWYVWSGWRKIDEFVWTWKDWWLSDSIIPDFSYLSNSNSTKNTSSIFWDIKSKTSRIPAIWEWDVEISLSSSDSDNYNMMDYENAQIFLLYYDSSTWNAYQKTSWDTLSSPASIVWEIRRPQGLSWFGPLDTKRSLVWTWPNNDAIVDWQVRGKYDWSPFTIYSKQSFAWKTIYANLDSAFRESNINGPLTFSFTNSRWDPLNNNNINIVSPKENEIKNFSSAWYYQYLFSHSEKPQIRFSLLNLLKDEHNRLYPFLEYYADFWTDVADKYFTIKAEWNFADYQVNLIIWKPTTKESVLWNFTSIF